MAPPERQPRPGTGWKLLADRSGKRGFAPRLTVWRRHGLVVSSSTSSAADMGIVGHVHVVAVSRQGGRPPRLEEFVRAVQDFGMEHALDTTLTYGVALQVWSVIPEAEA